MISRQLARCGRAAAAEARRGYASGFRSGRKEPPPPLVHSAKSSAPESTAKPEAPPPHPPPPPPPPPPPNPPAASPSASPEPAGGGPSLTAPLVLTAGVGLAAYYFSRDADDAAAREGAPRSSPRDRTGDRTAHRTAGSTPDAARATASESNTTDVPFESESTSTSKHEASRGAGNDATGDEVFRSAADSILAAARAAAEAADEAAEAEARRARKREEKEKGREKERRDRMERDSRRAAKRDPPADLAGPAGAARARALADADGDVRVQGGDALSPAALVTRAFEGAVEENQEWSATYKAMVYQAGEDAKAFAEELDRRRRAHAAELAALEARLTAEHAESAERAAASLAALASEIERYERRVTALATALERAGVDAELAAESASRDAASTTTRLLEEQHDAHTRATAECLVRERVERHAALDEIRARLDALRMVLDVNDANLRASHASNRASLAVFAMDDAVSRGAPFAREAALLRAAFTGADGTCEDSLVHAVLASISEETARRGAPTTASLRLRLVDAERAARSLALVPGGRDGGGGVLTYFVSALAAMCRVGESVTAEGGGVEAALAKAARAMAEGSVAAAADALESGTKGTAAERAVAGWVADARERQRMEMAMTVLRGHATAKAASLA